MGIDYNPVISTDGLIVFIDAANSRSYAGSGTIWLDMSGTGNTAYLINGAAYSGSGATSVISCDGTNDYIEILDNSSLDFGSNNFTVEYWAKKTQATSNFDNIWGPNKWRSGGGGAGSNEWSLTIGNGSNGNGDQTEFAIESGSTYYGVTDLNFTPTVNLWKQYVGVRSGATLLLYLNGVSIGSSSPTGMTSSTSVNNIAGRNLRINNSGLDQYYTKADNAILRIYNRALSASEILQNYNATKRRYGL